jgi:hypothetical protein
MNKAQYLEYIDHFNNKRFDAVTKYYAPDVTLEFYDNATYGAPARTLHGFQESLNNYRSLQEHTREMIELRDFGMDGDLMFAELYTEFYTFKTPPASYGRPWKAGDTTLMTNWVIYNLENDIMKRIRIAHFRMHDPATAKFSLNTMA